MRMVSEIKTITDSHDITNYENILMIGSWSRFGVPNAVWAARTNKCEVLGLSMVLEHP